MMVVCLWAYVSLHIGPQMKKGVKKHHKYCDFKPYKIKFLRSSTIKTGKDRLSYNYPLILPIQILFYKNKTTCLQFSFIYLHFLPRELRIRLPHNHIHYHILSINWRNVPNLNCLPFPPFLQESRRQFFFFLFSPYMFLPPYRITSIQFYTKVMESTRTGIFLSYFHGKIKMKSFFNFFYHLRALTSCYFIKTK